MCHHPSERKSHILESLQNSVFNFILLTLIILSPIVPNTTAPHISVLAVLAETIRCMEYGTLIRRVAERKAWLCSSYVFTVMWLKFQQICDGTLCLLVIVTMFPRITVRNPSNCRSRLESPVSQKTPKLLFAYRYICLKTYENIEAFLPLPPATSCDLSV